MLDNSSNGKDKNIFGAFKDSKKNNKGKSASKSLMPVNSTGALQGIGKQISSPAADAKLEKHISKEVDGKDDKFALTPKNKDNKYNGRLSGDAATFVAASDKQEESKFKLQRSSTSGEALKKNMTSDKNLEQLISMSLPEVFDVTKVYKLKEDNCQFCLKKLGFIKNPRHNCYKCGACVCEKCSENRIQLSLKDQTKYRVCNMCFSVTQNKPIIIFYKDLENAKDQRVKALTTKKLQYKEILLQDEREQRKIKQEIDDQRKRNEEELDSLAEELRNLRQEVQNKKETNKTFTQLLKTEETNLNKKLVEISELENQWNILKTEQANLEETICDLTNEVTNFLYQCRKYAKNTSNQIDSAETQNEFRRITQYYNEEKKKNDLKNKVKMKQEKLVHKNNIIFETSQENDYSAFGGESIDITQTVNFGKGNDRNQ